MDPIARPQHVRDRSGGVDGVDARGVAAARGVCAKVDADLKPGTVARGNAVGSDAYLRFALVRADGAAVAAAETGVVMNAVHPEWRNEQLNLDLPRARADESPLTLRVTLLGAPAPPPAAPRPASDAR